MAQASLASINCDLVQLAIGQRKASILAKRQERKSCEFPGAASKIQVACSHGLLSKF